MDSEFSLVKIELYLDEKFDADLKVAVKNQESKVRYLVIGEKDSNSFPIVKISVIPEYTDNTYIVFNIDDNNFLTLKDEKGNTRTDFAVKDKEDLEKIKEVFQQKKECEIIIRKNKAIQKKNYNIEKIDNDGYVTLKDNEGNERRDIKFKLDNENELILANKLKEYITNGTISKYFLRYSEDIMVEKIKKIYLVMK